MARGEMVGSRVPPRDRALIEAASKTEGVTVAEFIRRVVVPEAARVMQQSAADVLVGTAGPRR